jgi:hypothetical protein
MLFISFKVHLSLTKTKANIMQNYTVWVGGIEINDHYLNLKDAKELAEKYRLEGYRDIAIEKAR